MECFSCWTHHCVNNNALYSLSFLFSLSLSLSCCRFEQPKCDGNARAHPNKPKDHYRSRHLQGELNCAYEQMRKYCARLAGEWLKNSKRTRNKATKMKNNTFLPKRTSRKQIKIKLNRCLLIGALPVVWFILQIWYHILYTHKVNIKRSV